MLHQQDTIAAPATSTGGAIAVIRLSGAQAIECCQRIFSGRTPLSNAAGNTIHYGMIIDANRTIDDVLVSVFRAPHSYTGEDSVEISCHGSKYIVSEILSLLALNGVRMADAGEFTARAFLAGKIDLSQAEAVADMIASSSRAAHAVASTQMRGGYSAALGSLRAELLTIASLLELELDFSEEDVEFADRRQLANTMYRIGEQITRLSSTFALGNAIKEGVPVAIIGAPNVGKSTLLNRLLNEERALVSDIAGTTRDVIEEQTNIDGVTFRFLDTAGIRKTGDILEQMGIERTYAAIERARIIIKMIDVDEQPDTASIELSKGQILIPVINKIDRSRPSVTPAGTIAISAKTGEGVDALRSALRSVIDADAALNGDTIVTNSRHFEALGLAAEALQRAKDGLHNNLPTDLLSEEIRQVIHHIGTITGEFTTDEILGNIFSKFCIGK